MYECYLPYSTTATYSYLSNRNSMYGSILVNSLEIVRKHYISDTNQDTKLFRNR